MKAVRRRGEPLAVLALVLAGWVGVRAAVWEAPFPVAGPIGLPHLATRTKPPPRPAVEPSPIAVALVAEAPSERPADAWTGSFTPPLAPAVAPQLPLASNIEQPLAATPPIALSQHVAAAHQLLYLAALGQLPLPPGLMLSAVVPQARVFGTPPPVVSMLAAASAPRWSGDGWVLVRRGSGGLAAATGFPSYGASQAGGVIRYALAPNSANGPQAFVRVSRALGGSGGAGSDDGEVAAGLSARPFAGVPLRLLGEMRVQRGSGNTRVRPAASLVSELAPLRLPLGIAAEAYAQVGYAAAPLGQKRGATAFFDVQAIADRKLVGTGPAELRLGAGAWSGGQKGATRLDLGPRASLRLATGPATARIALDWRFRVAGNAIPASGPTLTFSTGF